MGAMSDGAPQAVPVGVLHVLALLAEVCLLVALAVGGRQLSDTPAVSLLLAVLLPCAAAVVWGRWCAPRSARRLPRLPRWAVKVTLFAAALGLVLNAEPRPGWGFFGLAMWLLFVVSLPADRDLHSGA